MSRAYGDLGVVFTEANLTGTQLHSVNSTATRRYTFRVRGVNDPSGAGPVAVPSSFSARIPSRLLNASLSPVRIRRRLSLVDRSSPGPLLLEAVRRWGEQPVWINKIERNAQGQPFQREYRGSIWYRWKLVHGESGSCAGHLCCLGTHLLDSRSGVVSEWSIAKTFRVTTIPT